MPFGLCNAPATYQRLMEEAFDGLHLKICYIYLDDIIIYSNTFEEHVDRLEQIFRRLREIHLKLSPKKCEFCKQKVKYVVHIVSEKGIEPDPEKIQKVIDWPTPVNSDQVRQFLGFVGYYRKFINDFSKIARPLTSLIPDSSKKTKRDAKTAKTPSPNWHWGQEEEISFQELKNCLIEFPILGFPIYDQPFEVHTDASQKGIGAVLYQLQDNCKRVIAYASRGLTKSDRNYPVHKLEFLALKWAVTEKFSDYLYGTTFDVITDNNPLTYVPSSAKLDATSQIWVASLATYNFSIYYRSGKSNSDADSMSRFPELSDVRDRQQISVDLIKTFCNAQCVNIPFVECLSISADISHLDN